MSSVKAVYIILYIWSSRAAGGDEYNYPCHNCTELPSVVHQLNVRLQLLVKPREK